MQAQPIPQPDQPVAATTGVPDVPALEDISRGILPTAVRPALARLLTGLFLLGIFTVPVVQVVGEWARGRHVQALDVFAQWPTRESLHQYEKELEKHSAARHAVQPRLQMALTRYGGVGNSNALLGRDGWLYYRPGVEYLTGPGLLDETRLRLRKKELADAGEKNPCPDPRPAIVAFDAACREAGVHLVVVPVPDKAMLQPGELTLRLAGRTDGDVPRNVDHSSLLAGLRDAGVDVFDPTPGRLIPGEPLRFLRQDTHWTPAWMETVARNLAYHLRGKVPALRENNCILEAREASVCRTGDLVDLLELRPGQSLFAGQQVAIRQVIDPQTGAGWQPHPEGDVLLLGDSFSNIYSVPDMGWGDSAGFPAQLARYLGHPVDVLARNGSGAAGVRRELARRPAPLAGKLVVVWEFAVRELMEGNWEVVPLPSSTPAGPGSSPGSDGPLVIEAVVQATSRVPQPGSMPYKDCLTHVKMHVERVIEGSYADGQLIAVMWGMKDNVLLPAAHYQPGKRLRLHLVPFNQGGFDLRAVRCVDDLDDFEHKPYLVVEEEGL
jgi:alginate O-acetyltransferase complex protein AlgJ